ncbi:Ig-like domain-containing protein [Sphaerotilus sp.]|uniref:Ig-like domain-containing protein n=1 Tax=Sphaerotilus sp. TaxID=2093942 RepID=UPI00286E799D|nr:Ig-like domain-containing protein [Sphaerotilus sp.]
MNKMIWRVGGLALAAALSACGGGGSDAGCSVFATSCTSTTTTGTTATTSTTGAVSTNSAGTVVLSLSSTTISASTPGTVTALVKDANGAPVSNTLVTFTVANGAATVSPVRVSTDAQGNASATLQPVVGALGADYISAAADVSTTSTLTTRSTFTVSAVNVALTAATASPASVSAYGSSVVTVNVTGASSSSPVTVNFSSTCVSAGKAILSPASITVTGPTASTTYQDNACAGTDRVSAAITGTSERKQVDLAVTAPVIQALEFLAASPTKICLAGSGCVQTAEIQFILKDQSDKPIANRDVYFSLDNANVASLSAVSNKTLATGIARVSVSAKAIPSPVRVRASVTLDDGTTLSTYSNVLAISAGPPTSNSISFSAAAYNPDGWARDGTESDIRVQLNDRYGNPVPDGTAVNFVAEGASVIPAICTTVSAVCNVKFVTSNFRPANGRVTVVAYARGEENFVDANGDNQYTEGETFTDAGPIFVDKDEDGLMAAQGEYLTGKAPNGKWDADIYVSVSRLFTLSDSSRAPRLFSVNSDGTCSNTALPVQTLSLTGSGACRLSTRFCMRDANAAADALGGNPVPANTALTLSTKAKGGTVEVDLSPVTGIFTGPTFHRIQANLDDCTKPLEAGGPIDLTVKMPNGQSYKFDIGVLQ